MTQPSSFVFHSRRVSILRSRKRSSFHTFVPTGSFQSSMFVASIGASGSSIQRAFSYPSLQNDTAGAYGRAVVATCFVAKSA